MSKVEVVPVNGKAMQKEFVRFAWKHYAGDANWIPPLIMNQQELLNYRKHPFYDNAEIQTFLAKRNGETVGRIAAIIDHAHNKTHNELRGMFGFFESIDDQAVTNALLDACKNWFAGKGIELMRGPLNPAMNYECGMLVEGFDSPPTFMMTYNKDYYDRLIKGYGFEKAQDLFAFWGNVEMLKTLDPKINQIAEMAQERLGLTTRKANVKSFGTDLQNFMRIYNHALPGTWGFVPLSEGEIKHIGMGLKMLIVPSMTRIAEKDGKAVAVVFGMLDYNPLIKKINGKLFPFGFLKLLFGRKKIKLVRMISTNVLPEYQRWGVGVILLKNLVDDILKWGVEEAEFSWVLESNLLSRGSLERGGAKKTKTYRIYDYQPS
ncbi:MAG: N-acetyltransferase [Pirellulaceae bacterium]